MAEGGGFGYSDADIAIDNDDRAEDGDHNDDDDQEFNRTQPFQPGEASTPNHGGEPYHGGEQHEMQTMMHEQEGLPSYDEKTPVISSTEDIERRLRNLRRNDMTGIIDTTKIKGWIENPLSKEDKQEQIRLLKKFIKENFPNAKVDKLMIGYSEKRPMDLVVKGRYGGETKILLDNGGGFQKSFLNATFIKKILGPPAKDLIQEASAHITKQNEERKTLNASRPSEQILRNMEETQTLNENLNRDKAIIAQLKDDPESDKAEIKRREQLVKNFEKELETKKKGESRT